MTNNIIIRVLFAPLSILFGIGVAIKNGFYRLGLLRGIRFDIPTISVGNLTTGGTGKSPFIELLVETLNPYIKIAILSRGYKRKTNGFQLLPTEANSTDYGDEPAQFKRKYPDVNVVVSESRQIGIQNISAQFPETQTILLDDAFQHRAVIPSLNILLTEFDKPYFNDLLLPAGNLREFRKGQQRADIIVVTKCPQEEHQIDQAKWLTKLKPDNRSVYFSYLKYKPLYPMYGQFMDHVSLDQSLDVMVICGIANPKPLIEYVDSKVAAVGVLNYPDHHKFTESDMEQIKKMFHEFSTDNKILLTTEKDAIRLENQAKFIWEHKLPIHILPIGLDFHFNDSEKFTTEIKQHLINFKV